MAYKYTPPGPGEAKFTFVTPYVSPEPGKHFVFYFGDRPSSYTISSEDVLLSLVVDDALTDNTIRIASEPVTLFVQVDNAVVDRIVVVLSDDFSLPCLFDSMVAKGGQAHNLPSGVSPGMVTFPWGECNELSRHINFPFVQASVRDNHYSIPWETFDNLYKDYALPFESFIPSKDTHITIPWRGFEYFVTAFYSYLYLTVMEITDNHKNLLWKDFKALPYGRTEQPYRHPQEKDKLYSIPWGVFENTTDFNFIGLYGGFNGLENTHIVYWGPKWYSLICERLYYPPKYPKVVFNPDDPNSEFADPEYDPFNFTQIYDNRCPYDYYHSGIRDRYEEEITPKPRPEGKDFYYIMNSVMIRRLPLGSPIIYIDWVDIKITLDKDSWLWDFTIVLPDSSYLDLIKPNGDVFTNIEITINGHVWTCMVEGWSKSKAFAANSWEVYGKSPSVVLGAPYCELSSYTNPDAVQGRALADDILSGTGYSVNWSATDWLNPVVDWLIPANVFSYADLTTIEALQKLTRSVGAYVQTILDPVTSKELNILPQFKKQPWSWASESEDMQLLEAQMWEVRRQYITHPEVNAVVVSGINNGVLTNVTRQGTAGDKHAPMVLEDLITTQEAGSERGRMLLGASGKWVQHTMKLFSLFAPTEPPGLILPGMFVKVTEEGTDWKGQVTGTEIHAVVSTGPIELSQTLEIEEYIP